MDLAGKLFLVVATAFIWQRASGAAGSERQRRNSISYCDLDGHARPSGGLDQSGPALGMLLADCPNQPLLCCIQHTMDDVNRMMERSNVTSVLDSFFRQQLDAVKAVLRTDLYRIGDILVRTIPQEFDMIDPIELNLIRPNVQDIFCQASANFAQDIDEPLCHDRRVEARAKANFILAGAYTSAAMTAMGYPGRLLSTQASRCVRAYTTRSYTTYSRHVDTLSCALHALQCQVKPALLALQSTAELLDRLRLLLHSAHFPGPRCRAAAVGLSVCPVCAGLQSVPPCLSSCQNVLDTCLEEMMDGQLHDVFLPVVGNALDRLQAIMASITTNLDIARKTIQRVIVEANRDVHDRLDARELKEEVNRSCRLSSILGLRYEPQTCSNLEPLQDYRHIMQQAIETTQYLKHSFTKLSPVHAWSLCPKASPAELSPGLCRDSSQPAPLHLHQAQGNTMFRKNVNEIMELFLTRNSHLFDYVASDKFRLLYDDEDSQGSYLVVMENGSGSSSSASGSSGDDDTSGSGSGDSMLPPTTPRPVIKEFAPLVCTRRPATTVIYASTSLIPSSRTPVSSSSSSEKSVTSSPDTSRSASASTTHLPSPLSTSRQTTPDPAPRADTTPPVKTENEPTARAASTRELATEAVATALREDLSTSRRSSPSTATDSGSCLHAASFVTIALSALAWAAAMS